MANFLCPFASFMQVLIDAGNAPQVGCLIWTYQAGTSTPQQTFTDITGGTPNSNPIQLNSAGRLNNVSIWQPGGVALKIQFSTNSGTVGAPVFGVQIGPTFDQVSGIDDPAGLLTSLINPATGSGADLVANTVRSYDLVASVRAANVPSLVAGQTLIIDVEGGFAVNDGFGGIFFWNVSSTAVDDGGVTTIKPTASGATGRYIRLNNQYGTIGSFNLTVVGCTTAPTVLVKYIQNNNFVVAEVGIPGGGVLTSNSASFSYSGWPLSLVSGAGLFHSSCLIAATDNSVSGLSATASVSSVSPGSLVIGLNNSGSGTWTASGTKGIGKFSISYFI